MRANIEQLKKDIADAKTRHSEATKDIKRIEKDMSEFSDNKDSKLAELQTSVHSLKKNLSKNSNAVKTLQKELQSSRLESEQVGSDLSAVEEQTAEVGNTLKAQMEEVESMKREQARIKVSWISLPCIRERHKADKRGNRMHMMSLKHNSTMKGPS